MTEITNRIETKGLIVTAKISLVTWIV